MNVSQDRILQEIGSLYLEAKVAQERLAASETEAEALREKVKALEEAIPTTPTA